MAEATLQFSPLILEVQTLIVPCSDKHPELWVRGLKPSRKFEARYCFRVAGFMVRGKPTTEIFLFFEALRKTTASLKDGLSTSV